MIDHDDYGQLVRRALRGIPQSRIDFEVDPTVQNNASRCMAYLINRRLSVRGASRPVKRNVFVWDDGLIWIRNSRVSADYWSSLSWGTFKEFHSMGTVQPAVHVFAHWMLDAQSLHVWVVAEPLIFSLWSQLPLTSRPQTRQLLIDLRTHQIRVSGDAPSLIKFHAQIALGEDEVEVLQCAIREDDRQRGCIDADEDEHTDADESSNHVDRGQAATDADPDLLQLRTQIEERLERSQSDLLALSARITAHPALVDYANTSDLAEITNRFNLIAQDVRHDKARLAEIGVAIVAASRARLAARLPQPAVNLLLKNWPAEGEVWSDLYAALRSAPAVTHTFSAEQGSGEADKEDALDSADDEPGPAFGVASPAEPSNTNGADVVDDSTEVGGDDSSLNISHAVAALEEPMIHRRSPEKRGGRPRGSRMAVSDEEQRSIEDVPPRQDRPRVRLELHRVAANWEVVAVVQIDASIDVADVVVRQQGRPLTSVDDGVFILNELSDLEIVVADRIRRAVPITWLVREVLAFRFVSDDRACMAARVTRDEFVLLVPLGWRSQHAEFMEAYELDSLPGYKLVFLDLTAAGDEIRFDATGGEQVIFLDSGGLFRCDGACIFDADPSLPPIYGPRLPDIVADSASAWQRIDTVVLVEEGDVGDAARRRASFCPTPNSAVQSMRDLTAFGSGWFSARLYDVLDNLVQVLSFRFVSSLKVTRSMPAPLPVEGRQSSVRILMQWNFGISVQVRPPENLAPFVKKLGVGIEVSLPLDDAQFDVTSWQLVVDGRSPLTMNLRVPRFWWAIDDVSWGCEEATLTREDFRASAGRVLRLKMPPHVEARVGFDVQQSVPVRAERDADERVIPLRLLGTQPVIAQGSHAADVFLWAVDGMVRVATVARSDEVQLVDDAIVAVDEKETGFTSKVESKSAFGARVYVPTETTHEVKIISETIVDYRHLAEVAGDEAFKWYVLRCNAFREAQCVKVLSDLVASAGLARDVPVIVFPVKRVKTEIRIGAVAKQRVDLEPAIEREYFFVVRRPEVSITHLIAKLPARELDVPISPDWLNQVLRFKQESETAVRSPITKGMRVLLTGGALTGAIGEVFAVHNGRRTATVGVELTDRVVPTEVSLDMITPA